MTGEETGRSFDDLVFSPVLISKGPIFDTVKNGIPEVVRHLWDQDINVMVSGSCLRSILNGEPYSDIDIYGNKNIFKLIESNFDIIKYGKHSVDIVVPGFDDKVNFVNGWECEYPNDVLSIVSDYTISSAVFFKIDDKEFLLMHPNWDTDVTNMTLKQIEKSNSSLDREMKLLSRGYKKT